MQDPINKSRLDEFEVEWSDDETAAYVTCGQKNILTFYDHPKLNLDLEPLVAVARPHALNLVLEHADRKPDEYTDKMLDVISEYIENMEGRTKETN